MASRLLAVMDGKDPDDEDVPWSVFDDLSLEFTMAEGLGHEWFVRHRIVSDGAAGAWLKAEAAAIRDSERPGNALRDWWRDKPVAPPQVLAELAVLHAEGD